MFIAPVDLSDNKLGQLLRLGSAEQGWPERNHICLECVTGLIELYRPSP